LAAVARYLLRRFNADMVGSLSRWMLIKFAGLGLHGPDFFDGNPVTFAPNLLGRSCLDFGDSCAVGGAVGFAVCLKPLAGGSAGAPIVAVFKVVQS
jgi:hypothetical protein